MAQLVHSAIANMNRPELLRRILNVTSSGPDSPAVRLAKYSLWPDTSLRAALEHPETVLIGYPPTTHNEMVRVALEAVTSDGGSPPPPWLAAALDGFSDGRLHDIIFSAHPRSTAHALRDSDAAGGYTYTVPAPRDEDLITIDDLYTNTQEEPPLPTKQEAANDLAVTVASASKAKAATELATAIANLSALSTPGLDEARVRTIAKEVASNEFATLSKGPQSVTVQVGATKTTPAINGGLCHYLFPTLNFWVNGGFNVYLYGPAGSSKTTSAKQLADVRSAEFGHFSMELTATRSDLLGYMAADGSYVPKSKFRDIYTMGGVFFLDEYDSPSTLHVALNTAFANGVCAFPNGDGVKHPDTIIVAAGNTAMGGGNSTYNGRQTVDGASVDRFVFLHWEEDWELVAAYNGISSVTSSPRIAATVERPTPPDAVRAKDWGTQWGKWVHDANAYVKLSKGAIKTLVTPRAVNAGIYAIVNSTLSVEDIADSVVFRWRDEAGKENILKNVPLPTLKGR